MKLHDEQARFESTGTVTFESDFKRRRLAGRIVSFDRQVRNGDGWWVFRPGSLFWSEPSRVHLDLRHDLDQLLGAAEELREAREGVDGVFRVARTPEGDRALHLAAEGALTGFSIEPMMLQVRRDPDDRELQIVERAQLRGVALTPLPSDDSARLSAVFEAPGVAAGRLAQRDAWKGTKATVLHKDDRGFAIGLPRERGFYDE